MIDFDQFALDQVERLGCVSDFRMSEAGRAEIASWLVDRSNGDDAGKSRIRAVIDECVEFASAPGLADIKAVWYRLYPAESAHQKCGACGGTGYVIVERNGMEGAVKCGGAHE